MIGLQSAAIVPHPHQGAAATAMGRPRLQLTGSTVTLRGSRWHGGKHWSGPRDNAVNRQIGRLSASRRATAKLRFRSRRRGRVSPDRRSRAPSASRRPSSVSPTPAQPFQYSPIGLLQGIDLLQDGTAVPSQRTSRPVHRHPRSASARRRAPATRRDKAQIHHAARGRFPCVRHPAAKPHARRGVAACRRRHYPGWPRGDFSLSQIAASSGGPSGLTRASYSSRFDPRHRLGQNRNWRERPPTTVVVMMNRTIAIAEPISSWVTMPSQISATSSFGWEVISSEPVLPAVEIGTFTAVFSGCTSAMNHAGGERASSLSSDRALLAGLSAASPCSVMLTWRSRLRSWAIWFQPRIGVRYLVQSRDDRFDKFTGQSDDTLIFSPNAGRGFENQPGNIDRQA